MIEQLKSGLSSATSNMGEKLKDSFSFFSDIKDAGWDKVSTLITTSWVWHRLSRSLASA